MRLIQNALLGVALACAFIISSCSLFMESVTEEEPVTDLTLQPSTVSMNIGSVQFLTLSISPDSAHDTAQVTYTYDETVISVDGDNNGAVISGLKSGNTVLKATAGGRSAACVISVSGVDPSIENAPVISTTTPVVELEAGVTKKVMVSLNGGIPSDMAGFSWSIDKGTIASVDPAGQNAIITAKSNGIARVTVTHVDAAYPMYILVFVKPSEEKPLYITTSRNLVTLGHEDPETNLSVALVNGDSSDYPFFAWSVLDDSTSNPDCITLTANGQNAIITPKSAGEAIIQVSHPSALYTLNVHVRVTTIVEHVYIEPSSFRVLVDGETAAQVNASLTGASNVNQLDPSDFVWTLDSEEYCAMTAYADSVVLLGKKNGTSKLTVSHPAARYSRELLVTVENQLSDAVDGAMYITSSQNFVRTKVGIEDIPLSVSLVGGIAGDEADFVWTVNDPDIIGLTTTNGTVNSRSIGFSRTGGTAYIDALKEGVTTISVSHPKIVVPLEILVKVLSEYAVLEEPAYISGPSLLGIVLGETKTVNASLYGNEVIPSDQDGLVWTSLDGNVASVAGNGSEGIISALSLGTTSISIEHPKADNPKKILIYVAATQEDLDAYRLLYSEKTYFTILAGDTQTIGVSSMNILDSELSSISWQVENPEILQIEVGTTNLNVLATGLKTGETAVIASMEGIPSVRFEVTVLPEGTDTSVLPDPVYLTTGRNVIQFSEPGSSQTAVISAIGLSSSKYQSINWEIADPEVAEVISNGTSATISALSEGVTTITVSHPESENTLILTIRIGERYIVVNPNTPYIVTSRDVVSVAEGSPGVQISAQMYNSALTQGFTWTIDDPTIATITSLNSTCFIVPKALGQANVTVTHADAEYDKKVLVLVQNTPEDLADIPYLTTAQNMVNLKTGTQQTISVKLQNSTETTSGFTWTSDNPSILQIVASGQQASFKAIAQGIARVTISHSACKYHLEIITTITDLTSDAADNPYITSAQNIVTVTSGSISKSISLTLAGGTEQDLQFFQWSVDRPDVVQLTANAQSAVVKGIAPGEARITVTHPKALYPFTITVISEAGTASSSLYINTSKSIITMKPADEEQTVSASLVGGVAEDKYGFNWYADNYNVIDLTFSANMAVIAPKQEGTAVITVTHPKAGFDATITVRVTEYSTFAFAQPSLTVTEGTTQFVSMQVPAIEGDYAGRVVYATDNPQIVTITGTNKVAQVTAVASGTAVVTATSPSGATSDMMVYVKKGAENTLPYITSNVNVISMKATDNQRSITASLVGQDVIPTDQYNLAWTVSDPGIVELIGSTGTSVLVRPLSGGETTIRISHPKTESIFSIWIKVDSQNNGLSLDRNYLALETGKTAELTATIDNGTAEQYKSIVWSATKVNGDDICTILGSGKTVAVYAIKVGQTSITAEYNGQLTTCDLIVSASRQFSFDTQTMRIQPGQTKTFKYTLVPDDTAINWTTNSNDYVTYNVDASSKTVTVTGISEGIGSNGSITKLTGIANSMSASITITCSWDYTLTLGTSLVKGEPREAFAIPYSVNPSDATIAVQISSDIAGYVVDTAKSEIRVTPTKEGDATLVISATNPYNGQRFATQSCALSFAYNSITLNPVLTAKTGSFSRYSATENVLYLGDGETVSLTFDVVEPNVEWQIESVAFNKSNSSSQVEVLDSSISNKTKLVVHPTDAIGYEYLVTDDTYFAYNGVRIKIVWQLSYHNSTNYYYVAKIGASLGQGTEGETGYIPLGTDVYLSRYATSTYNVLAAYPTAPDGDGYFGTSATGLSFHSVPYSIPRRVSVTEFKSNTDWYVPIHEYRTRWNTGFPFYDTKTRNGEAAEIYINNAQIVPVLNDSLVSSLSEGVLNVTILRSGKREIYQIPVVVETRNCLFDR